MWSQVVCSSGSAHACLAERFKSSTDYGGSTPSVVYIPFFVLQGSVLDLHLFILIIIIIIRKFITRTCSQALSMNRRLYIADLEDHVSERGVSFHAYADDMQLYSTLSSQQHDVGHSVT